MGARDQVGFLEMRDLVERTGGLTVLSESFAHEVNIADMLLVEQAGEEGPG